MLPTLEVGEGREKRERTFNSGTNGAKERVLHARAVNKRGLLVSRVSLRVEFHFVSHASFPAWSFWTEIESLLQLMLPPHLVCVRMLCWLSCVSCWLAATPET